MSKHTISTRLTHGNTPMRLYVIRSSEQYQATTPRQSNLFLHDYYLVEEAGI